MGTDPSIDLRVGAAFTSAGPSGAYQACDAPDGVDRRRSKRHPAATLGAILPANGDASRMQLQVLVVNVSLGGAGLRSPVAFAPGDLYQLRIGTGPLLLSSQIRIVSSRSRPDGQYDVGVEFI
jgi:hypothetical protein